MDFVAKIERSLVDIDGHERKIGRCVRMSDKDAWYWEWKLTSTGVLNERCKKRR